MAKTPRFIIFSIGIVVASLALYLFILNKITVIEYTNLLQERNELYIEYTTHYSTIQSNENSNTYALVLAQQMLEVDNNLDNLQLKPYYPEYTKLLERIDSLRVQLHIAISQVTQNKGSLQVYLDADTEASMCLSSIDLNDNNNATIVKDLNNCITKLEGLNKELIHIANIKDISLPLTGIYINKRISYWSNVSELYETEKAILTISQIENDLTISKNSSEKELNGALYTLEDISIDQLATDINYLQEETNNWLLEND